MMPSTLRWDGRDQNILVKNKIEIKIFIGKFWIELKWKFTKQYQGLGRIPTYPNLPLSLTPLQPTGDYNDNDNDIGQ